MSRVLLDTHAVVWWLEGRPKLSRTACDAIEDSENTVFVSAASAWELAIKAKLGKFKSPQLARHLDHEIEEEGFVELPISIEHALRAGSLGRHHNDPFDRMLIAQAQIERMPIVSKDDLFDQYAIQRIW